GSNGLGGEWSLNQMPEMDVQNLNSERKIDFSNRIEGFLSGKSIEKNFHLKFGIKMTAKEIFFNYKKKEKNSYQFINDYKVKLARALVILITTIDPDAIVFGGGVSNEIDFLDEIKKITSKFINEPNLKTVFLKPLYGDASGVRGAALLGRENFI
ncbi:ROK family protein, partial [Candidatus Pelagibacter bacterium]|nr:ROK family protein [Candidatus Pelagibacter bacterium]